MRSRPHAHVAGESHGIDLAPMLDFVVNLLVFFIITAVFVKQAGLEVKRPSVVPDDDSSTSKSFAIDDRGEITVDSKPIDLRTVRAHVEQLKAVEARGGIVVMADRHAPMGVVGRKLLPAFAALPPSLAVVAVTDQIRLAGVSDITFTTTTLAKQQR